MYKSCVLSNKYIKVLIKKPWHRVHWLKNDKLDGVDSFNSVSNYENVNLNIQP